MKFCSQCGKELLDAAVVCPHCGCAVPQAVIEPDEPSVGLNILSFFIPLVGLILFIVYSGKSPVKAKSIGTWALIGFVVGLLLLMI